jgi:hypothetical protein
MTHLFFFLPFCTYLICFINVSWYHCVFPLNILLKQLVWAWPLSQVHGDFNVWSSLTKIKWFPVGKELQYCVIKDICQCLKTVLDVTTNDCLWGLVTRNQRCCYRSYSFHNKVMWNKVSIVSKLKSHDLNHSESHIPEEHICRLILNRLISKSEKNLSKGDPLLRISRLMGMVIHATVTLCSIPCQHMHIRAYIHAQTGGNVKNGSCPWFL